MLKRIILFLIIIFICFFVYFIINKDWANDILYDIKNISFWWTKTGSDVYIKNIWTWEDIVIEYDNINEKNISDNNSDDDLNSNNSWFDFADYQLWQKSIWTWDGQNVKIDNNKTFDLDKTNTKTEDLENKIQNNKSEIEDNKNINYDKSESDNGQVSDEDMLEYMIW